MNDNQEHPVGNEPLDEYITGTLRRDAESLRAQFGTVPNDRMTAKLALRTASRGLFQSLGAKFAMYAGAAAIVAGILYWLPQKSGEPSMPSKPEVPTPAATHDTVSSHNAQKNATVAKEPPSPRDSRKAKKLRLDEGDTGTIPVYTDPNYKAPTH